MADRSGYTAEQRHRIIRAVAAAVTNRPTGAVWKVDALELEGVASKAGGRRYTPERAAFCRDAVAEALAQREESQTR